jgi:hypothetical protein
MGDSPLVDIISVQAQVTNVDLEVSVTFNTPPESFTGIMIIDLDQDPTTGIADLGVPGAEAVADINYDEIINLTQLSIRTSAQDYSTLDTHLFLEIHSPIPSRSVHSATISMQWTSPGRSPKVGGPISIVYLTLECSPPTPAR